MSHRGRTGKCDVCLKRNALWGYDPTRPNRCYKHVDRGMYNHTTGKKDTRFCVVEGCHTRASYLTLGKRMDRCSYHSLFDEVPQKMKKCEVENCTAKAAFAYIGATLPLRCLAHRVNGDVVRYQLSSRSETRFRNGYVVKRCCSVLSCTRRPARRPGSRIDQQCIHHIRLMEAEKNSQIAAGLAGYSADPEDWLGPSDESLSLDSILN